jgi:hypothetical protein
MSEFLDELARSLAKPMPRRRALRVLGGALVTVATPASLLAGRASAAGAIGCDKCGAPHGAGCVTPGACGKFPLENEPVCCTWPGYFGPIRKPHGGICAQAGGNGLQPPGGAACCCPKGTSCGNPAVAACVCAHPCGTDCCGEGSKCCAGKCCEKGEECVRGACREKVCGPDITGALEDAVSRTEAAFGKWSSTQRAVACIALVETPIGAVGWEINQLGPGNREQGAENFRPECATCATSLSVQVGRGCHYAGSVNYVVYGVMLRLCHGHLKNSALSREAPFFTEEQMVRYITLWKSLRNAPNLTASLAWAKAGYNRWPDAPTPPPELPNCAKCPKALTSRMTVRWLPLDRNI